jgi:hypothetical protein
MVILLLFLGNHLERNGSELLIVATLMAEE